MEDGRLARLGFGPFQQRCLAQRDAQAPAGEPARVVAQERERYHVEHGGQRRVARAAGRLALEWTRREQWPVVGDWVLLRTPVNDGEAVLEDCLPRRTELVRKVAGERAEAQVLAANVDVVLLVASLAAPLNVRRLERHLTAVWDTGATPVLVLNKADLCDDVEAARRELDGIAMGVEVLVVSATGGPDSVAPIAAQLDGHRTGVLLGPSGVGKSTLTNALLGEEVLATGAVREEDQKGRHTTTRRELFVLPQGGILIDTPGLREFALWDGGTEGFQDIQGLAADCRFRDCQHDQEPGCAVQQAVADGVLDAGRFESYQKLQRELHHIAVQKDEHARRHEKQRTKQFMKLVRSENQRKARRWDGPPQKPGS